MEHQHQHHKGLATCRIGILLLVAILLVGCRDHQPEVGDSKEFLSTSVPSFTYSTINGAIWRVDVDSHKTQLLPDDGIQKWKLSWAPNRQQLAYVTREFLQTGTSETGPISITTTESVEMTMLLEMPTHNITETLIVLNADGTNCRQLGRPAQAIQYTWVDNCTIDLQLAQQTRNGEDRWQWDKFQVNVETGVVTPREQENRSAPVPIITSPDGQWALLFETGAETKQIHLLDANGDKVTTLYKGPSDRDVVSRWSQNSRYVFYLSYAFYQSDDIQVYDLATGETTKVTDFIEQENSFMIWVPHWLPTGEKIFFLLDTQDRTNQPCLVDLPESTTHCFDISTKSDQLVWSTGGQYLAFLAPRGDEAIDIYCIDTATMLLTNLTRDGDDIVEDWIAP